MIILFIIALIILIISLIFLYNPAYCYIFEHKEWGRWMLIINNLDNATFRYVYNQAYNFYLKINEKEYDVVYWGDENLVSVHKGTCECVCCTFNEYLSKKAEAFLCKKFNFMNKEITKDSAVVILFDALIKFKKINFNSEKEVEFLKYCNSRGVYPDKKDDYYVVGGPLN